MKWLFWKYVDIHILKEVEKKKKKDVFGKEKIPGTFK